MSTRQSVLLWVVLGAVFCLWAFGIWLRGQGAYATPPKDKDKVLIRAYDASYSPTEQLLVEIRDEMRALRSDIKAAVSSGQIHTDGKAVFNARCARCHQEGVTEEKGSGIVLVLRDGSIPPFSTLEKRHIEEQIRTNKMPKGGQPLSEVEKRAILESINFEVQPQQRRGK